MEVASGQNHHHPQTYQESAWRGTGQVSAGRFRLAFRHVLHRRWQRNPALGAGLRSVGKTEMRLERKTRAWSPQTLEQHTHCVQRHAGRKVLT